MKKVTRFFSVGIACFCMASVMGQKIMPLQSIVDEQFVLKQNEIELRANGTDFFWPDSIVNYNAKKERTSVVYYDKVNRKVTADSLINGKWVSGNPKDTEGYVLSYSKVRLYEVGEERRFSFPSVWPSKGWYYDFHPDFKANTFYDNKDNLTLVEIIGHYYEGTDRYMEFHMTYNEKNNPVRIEEYWYGSLSRVSRYEYNADGYMTLFEVLENIYGKLEILEGLPKETAEFDKQGRPAEMRQYLGNEFGTGWLSSVYSLFYFSDGVSNEKVETLAPAIYVNQDRMYVQSVRNEIVTVYSISGVKLLETAVQSGLNSIPIANLPQGVLLVTGSNGWTKKLIAK
jgi:hypothetical protein